jgi:hypothetical protein
MTGLDPERLLAEAHDFLVDDPDGPVGVVDEIVPDEAGSAEAIVVACGWFGRRVLVVAPEDVDEILPEEKLLVLRRGLPAVREVRRAQPTLLGRIRTSVLGTLRGRHRSRGRAVSGPAR